jgi:hypothetical protein
VLLQCVCLSRISSIFYLIKKAKSKAVNDIKEILYSKADCDKNESRSKQARVLSEDEQLVAMLNGSSRSGKASS